MTADGLPDTPPIRDVPGLHAYFRRRYAIALEHHGESRRQGDEDVPEVRAVRDAWDLAVRIALRGVHDNSLTAVIGGLEAAARVLDEAAKDGRHAAKEAEAHG